jgi:hypothetical protein
MPFRGMHLKRFAGSDESKGAWLRYFANYLSCVHLVYRRKGKQICFGPTTVCARSRFRSRRGPWAPADPDVCARGPTGANAHA